MMPFKKFLSKYVKQSAIETYVKPIGKVRAKTYNIKKTIVLAGTPRGGTTWLSEILLTIPNYYLLWEPVSVGLSPRAAEYNFYPDTFLPVGSHHVKEREYLESVLMGSNLSVALTRWEKSDYSKFLFAFDGYLVKFVRGNLLFNWLCDEFSISGILLFRHPCAVVASQLRHDGWENVKTRDYSFKCETWRFPPGFAERFPHLWTIYQDIDSVEAALAFDWAIQTYVPLSYEMPHPWFLTTYERLVVDGHNEVKRIFSFLGREVPDEAINQLHIPSSTTDRHSCFAKHGNPLIGWQKQLSTKQIDSILKVVSDVGVDFYSDELEPDYKKLRECYSYGGATTM